MDITSVDRLNPWFFGTLLPGIVSWLVHVFEGATSYPLFTVPALILAIALGLVSRKARGLAGGLLLVAAGLSLIDASELAHRIGGFATALAALLTFIVFARAQRRRERRLNASLQAARRARDEFQELLRREVEWRRAGFEPSRMPPPPANQDVAHRLRH